MRLTIFNTAFPKQQIRNGKINEQGKRTKSEEPFTTT